MSENTMNGTGNEGGSVTVALPEGGTFAFVIGFYQTEPESTFHNLQYAVRENHRNLLRRISAKYGHWKLENIDTKDLKGWYREWSEGGKIASGHAFMGQIRTILTQGVLLLPNGYERVECRRIKELLHDLKFPQPAPREEVLTIEEIIEIRAVAHRHFGWHSIALAQAFQFELMLRQGDVIGSWIPESEPGEAILAAHGRKWSRGICWSEVDENMIIRHITSKRRKPIAADLRGCPMIIEELELSGGRCGAGPIIICDTTGLPWYASEFRRKWRMIADKAGVPKNKRQMDTRASSITEAYDAGVDEDLIRQGATHSNVTMTRRYNRRDMLKGRSAMQLQRVEGRKKATGE